MPSEPHKLPTEHVVIDSTGTVLDAATCALVPSAAIPAAQWDAMNNGATDSEIAELRQYGRPVMRDVEALDAIAALLDGTEWDSETLSAIAEQVLTTGRTIRDLED